MFHFQFKQNGDRSRSVGSPRLNFDMAAGLGIDDFLEWGRTATLPVLDPHQVLCSMLRSNPNINNAGEGAADSSASRLQSATRAAMGLGSQQPPPAIPTERGEHRASFTVPTGGIGIGEAFEEKKTLRRVVDLTTDEQQSVENIEDDDFELPSSPFGTLSQGQGRARGDPVLPDDLFRGHHGGQDQGFHDLPDFEPFELPDNMGGPGSKPTPPRFPPSPPRRAMGSWFARLGAPHSPLRALIRPAMDWWASPSKGRGKAQLQLNPAGGSETALKNANLGTKRKLKGKLIKAVALSMKKSKTLQKEFESRFSSSTSKAPKESRRKLVTEILKVGADGGAILPLTANALKHLAATLWKAGYDSAELYVVEAKLMHVEEGYEWTSQLDLMLKRCKRGTMRNRGPRKKANEVPKERREERRSKELPEGISVLFPRELFMFAMTWMLREIELSKMERADVKVDKQRREVTLLWRGSKMDPSAKGVARVLSCVCEGNTCETECPYFVTVDLLAKVSKFMEGEGYFCIARGKRKNKRARKDQIVKSWALAYGMKVSGHSARRSGALNYIRKGWAISQVAFLGRWTSSVIYGYAQEALESLAVNAKSPQFRQEGVARGDGMGAQACGVAGPMQVNGDHIQALEVEIAEVKRDHKRATEALKKEVSYLKNNFGSKRDGPPRVQGLKSKVVHDNITPVTSVPPCMWKTRCGWYFRGGDFGFVKAEEEVTCAKCLGTLQNAQTQGGEGCIL